MAAGSVEPFANGGDAGRDRVRVGTEPQVEHVEGFVGFRDHLREEGEILRLARQRFPARRIEQVIAPAEDDDSFRILVLHSVIEDLLLRDEFVDRARPEERVVRLGVAPQLAPIGGPIVSASGSCAATPEHSSSVEITRPAGQGDREKIASNIFAYEMFALETFAFKIFESRIFTFKTVVFKIIYTWTIVLFELEHKGCDLKENVGSGSRSGAVASQDAIHTHVGFLLSRAHLRIRRAMQEASAGSGLHLGHIAVLGALFSSLPLSQRELTDLTGIERSTMVLVIDALETMGFVRRRPHPGDRRAHAVELTPAGLRAMGKLGPRLVAAEDAVLAPFSTSERRTLAALLRRIVVDAPA